jgi:hypothetical protein
MLTGLTEKSPACLASADVGMFDHAENTKAAAQAMMRTIRIGALL